MEPGIAAVGVVVGAVVGAAIERQQAGARRQAARLARVGELVTGTVTAASVSGRYGAWTRLTIAVPSGAVVEAVSTTEAARAGWQVGAPIVVRVDPADPTSARIERETPDGGRSGVGVGVGALIAALAIAGAVVA